MRKPLIILGLALGLFALAFILFFRGALTQEGNPVPFLQAILRVEFKGDTFVPVPGRDNLFIQKISTGDSPLIQYLAQSGWEYRERLGSAIFFDKDDATLSASTRMFTRRYVIYEIEDN